MAQSSTVQERRAPTGSRCPRCLGRLDDDTSAPHHLEPDEAAAWAVPPGAYHEGCCPECNGPAAALPPFPDFEAAASTVAAHLGTRLGFAACMVTRVELGRLSVVAVDDRHFGLQPGTTLRWDDSICTRMAAGGPRSAPDLGAVPAYAAAPLARQLGVGAYVGAPLEGADGSLLGSLAALHPTPATAGAGEQALLELHARILSTLLSGWARPPRRAATSTR